MKGVHIRTGGSNAEIFGRAKRAAAAMVCMVFLFAGGMLGCGGKEAEVAGSKDQDQAIQWLEVSVHYEDGSLLPAGSVMTVTLEDVSRMDISNRFVGETVLDVEGASPYATSIGFNPWLIMEDHTYAVTAVIRHYNHLLYQSADIPVTFEKKGKGPLSLPVKRVPRPRLIHSR